MYAITTCAPTKHDNSISRLYLAWVASVRQDAKATTKDKRVINIFLVIKDSTVDGGNTHFIAIVAHTIDYTAGDTMWRKDTSRQFISERVRRSEAENICAGNWLSRDAQHVTNDAANAGIRPSKWFDCRGMIMCFNFEGDILRFCEAYDACVIAECRYHPGMGDLLCGSHDVL